MDCDVDDPPSEVQHCFKKIKFYHSKLRDIIIDLPSVLAFVVGQR